MSLRIDFRPSRATWALCVVSAGVDSCGLWAVISCVYWLAIVAPLKNHNSDMKPRGHYVDVPGSRNVSEATAVWLVESSRDRAALKRLL